MKRITTGILVLSLLALSGCLITQGGQSVDARLQKLELDVAEVEKISNHAAETVDRNVGQMADSQIYFENMRQEFEAMKGAFDESKYAQGKKSKDRPRWPRSPSQKNPRRTFTKRRSLSLKSAVTRAPATNSRDFSGNTPRAKRPTTPPFSSQKVFSAKRNTQTPSCPSTTFAPGIRKAPTSLLPH